MTLTWFLILCPGALVSKASDTPHDKPLLFDFRSDPAEPGICMLSMTDARLRIEYTEQIHSHVCYAESQGLIYHNKQLTLPPPGVPPTHSKLGVVEGWMHKRHRCAWVWWVDSDVTMVNMNYSIRAHLSSSDALVMTDHHAALNNGGFLFSTSWPRWSEFFAAWHAATARNYPFTDNGRC